MKYYEKGTNNLIRKSDREYHYAVLNNIANCNGISCHSTYAEALKAQAKAIDYITRYSRLDSKLVNGQWVYTKTKYSDIYKVEDVRIIELEAR